MQIDVPEALEPLLAPARYKGAFGGRGGAKSHFFAQQLVARCLMARTRAACIREVQQTIKDSVRQLIIDKIQALDVGRYFEPVESEIRGPHGSLIVFKGMQSYNAENIKSLEDFDLAWVEEAQTLSEKSLRLLRPTIRKNGSELWFSWNPRHPTDAVDKFFRGDVPPPDAIAVEVGWKDNPWFPDVLKAEKDRDYLADPEMADHVWGGGYELISEQYYYARHVKDAEDEDRCGDFPHDPTLPVDTSWDLGVDDHTSIWFWQTDGNTATVIDYYEVSGDGAQQIIADALPEYTKDPIERAKALGWLKRTSGYTYREHFFPHDIAVREWGQGARTRVETVMSLGIPQSSIRCGVATDPADRVQASRALFPAVRFNTANPRVAQGVTRLRRYARRWNEALGTYTGPLKDGNDHAADAFGEYCINSALAYEPPPEPKREPTPEELARIPLPPVPSVGGGTQRRGL